MRLFKNRVVRNSGLELYNLTDEEATNIKEALTFKNPKYESVQKFSKWTYTRVPKNLFYYEEYKVKDSRVIRVPYGFDYSKYIDRTLYKYDEPAKNKVSFPSFLLKLRETQKESSEAFLKKGKGIIILPTGKGKSILGMYIASRFRVRTLVIVHKNDLIDGWKADAKLCFGENFKTGLIKAKKRDINSLTLATVQTLSRMTEEELTSFLNIFDFVIQDECHRSPAPTFSMVDRFNAKYKLGLTATLERADGLAHMINLYFGDVVYEYKVTENEKDILPVEVIPRNIKKKYDPWFTSVYYPAIRDYNGNVIKSAYYELTPAEEVSDDCVKLSDPRFAEEKKTFVDFSYHDLDTASVLDHETIEVALTDILTNYKMGYSCIVFFSQKSHLETYRKLLSKLIPSEQIGAYYGDNTDEENKRVKEMAERKEILVTLTTYSKAGEGTNCKSWEVAFLLSSISEGKKVEQAVGRIRRVKKGKLKTVKVYDYNYSNFVILNKHYPNRLQRYSKLGFKVLSRTPIFKLGFRAR